MIRKFGNLLFIPTINRSKLHRNLQNKSKQKIHNFWSYKFNNTDAPQLTKEQRTSSIDFVIKMIIFIVQVAKKFT